MKRRWQGWRKGIALVWAAVVAVVGLTLTLPGAKSMEEPSRELRGVWLTNIDSDVLFSRDRLEQGIRKLAHLNFNTLYPTVWNWGYTLYPSEVATQVIGTPRRLYPDLDHTGQADSREAAQRDRNLLKEVIAIAHGQHLKVIPWFEFGFMAPSVSELVQQHPTWLTQRRDGSTLVMEGQDPRVWLNPFHPEVQQFILDLVAEVVAHYDVDGIQFDDHFGLPVELGYDSYTLQRYQQDHQGKSPPSNPRDAEWVRWRAAQLTEFMGKVFRTVKVHKPKAIVSLSPNPAPFAYETFLQDWVTWEQLGYLEELVVQVYRQDRNRFLMELARPELQRARQHIPVSIGILAGLKGREVPMNWIVQQVKWVRDRQFAGVSFFFYETLWASQTESPRQRSRSLQALFNQPVEPPTLQLLRE